MNDNPDFAALHRAMKKIVEAQDAAGWQSTEIERATKRILLALWVCANNDPPTPIAVLDALASDVAALDKARGQQ